MNLGMFNGREVTAEPTNDGRRLLIEARGNFEHPAQIMLSQRMEEQLLELLKEREAERSSSVP